MGYRNDLFIRLIKTLDERSNRDEDEGIRDENTIQDLFFPISEKLTLSDDVTVQMFTASLMVWGNGTSVPSNWLWSLGGRWT